MKKAHLAASLFGCNRDIGVLMPSVADAMTPLRSDNMIGISSSIRRPRGPRNGPGLIVKRCAMGSIVLCLGFLLGSCSAFSGAVADHWPHWAGGEPDDVPPRPGAPGYDEFIAHKQPDENAAKPAGSASNASPQPASSRTPPADDPMALDGGLY